MKFGLFYELQLPKTFEGETWDPDAEHRIYQEMLDQVELADQLGFDYVFEVEHHFLEEYSHSSAPELMMAALSQRTKNIRLGHGIVLTPPAYNHPARVAERISALDLASVDPVERRRQRECARRGVAERQLPGELPLPDTCALREGTRPGGTQPVGERTSAARDPDLAGGVVIARLVRGRH